MSLQAQWGHRQYQKILWPFSSFQVFFDEGILSLDWLCGSLIRESEAQVFELATAYPEAEIDNSGNPGRQLCTRYQFCSRECRFVLDVHIALLEDSKAAIIPHLTLPKGSKCVFLFLWGEPGDLLMT